MNRNETIVRTSMVGIGVNIILAVFKAVVGLLSNSIAVVTDALNNMSDALSSVITIVGAKLAAKKPDKKHPLGYGRVEYLSSLIVSGIVMVAGINAVEESIRKIISPEKPSYSPVTLIILVAAVIGKVLLGRYMVAQGKKVDSDSLIASGKDSLNDAILSSSVILSAVIFILTGLSLEPYVGIVIGVMITRSGIEMIKETLDKILGERMDRDLVNAVKKTICEEPGVYGAYDLILNSYGPERLIGSVHIEVDEFITARQIDQMQRSIVERVAQKHKIILTGISLYSHYSSDGNESMQGKITKAIMSHDGVLQMHGFYVDETRKYVTLDVILDFEADQKELLEKIQKEVDEIARGYTVEVNLDLDI